MLSPQVVVVVVALSTSVTVVADIRVSGPYVLDLEEFSACEDKGSILVKFNVKRVLKDDKAVFDGYLKFPYDMDDENILTVVNAYKWGSTGGWGKDYPFEHYDIMSFLMENLPEVFESFFGSMGITRKPMPAGTYHLRKFKPMGLKLKKFPALQYGHYKLVVIQSRNGTELCCLQCEVWVKEI